MLDLLSLLVLAAVAVGVLAVGTAVYGLFIRPLRSEEHSFTRTRGARSRADRAKMPRTAAASPTDSYMLNKDSLYIFHREWTNTGKPEDVRTVIVLCHGFAEHSARYTATSASLLKSIPNCAIVALDLQGHGQSEGDRLFVREFEDYCDDVMQLARLAKIKFPNAAKANNNFVLLGHSMGGLVAIRTVQRASPELFNFAVISAPALSLKLSPVERQLGPWLADYLPKLVTKSSVALDALCHDVAVVDLYANDPLCVTQQGATARLGGELMQAGDKALAFAHEVQLPYLLIRGKQDTIALPEGIAAFHQATTSKDKTLIEFEGMLHEIFNEPGDKAVQAVVGWLKQRVVVHSA